MDQDRRIPASLKVVAVLFILGGIFAAIEVLVSLAHGHLNFDFGVLGIFIGRGLLALRPGWRTCALVFLWIGMVVSVPIVAVLLFIHSGKIDFRLFGEKVGHAPKELGLCLAVILFLLCLWQYRVLVRPDVRELFGLKTG